jgi:hypothetical protein
MAMPIMRYLVRMKTKLNKPLIKLIINSNTY